MNRNLHKIFIITLVTIVVIALLFLILQGFDYYSLALENRFFHDKHYLIKPSGLWGHGFGVIGTFMILFGVFSYMARKRISKLSRLGLLKHWLEFHIFLCVLGPILVLFHTSFKFGGIVSVSFWSMVAIVLSGVIGRFIYIQIPRSIEGRELTQGELALMQSDLNISLANNQEAEKIINQLLTNSLNTRESEKSSLLITRVIRRFFSDKKIVRFIRKEIKKHQISLRDSKVIISTFKKEITLRRKIDLLSSMQNLLRYWHVAHLPFAFVMLVIMLIHVTIVIVFGYKWVF